jgi:multiple sugar transport system substrate-binding protein
MTQRKKTGTEAGAPRGGASRRSVLKLMGAASAAGLAGHSMPALAQPAVRKKAKIVYWNWADNPAHLKISTDVVDAFNKAQDMIEVELDANMAVADARRKLVTSFAAGAAPDVIIAIQYWVQDLYTNGIIEPLNSYFDAWDAKEDFFQNVVEGAKARPDGALTYTPLTNIVYNLYYRADWLKEAGLGVPETYDHLIAASMAMANPPERYGYGLRGQPYQGIEMIHPIWRSAGVEIVDQNGNVDFDSPAAIEVAEKWIGMLTKDKSVPPTAVNDGMREIYTLFQNGKIGMWLYPTMASRVLMDALGDNVQYGLTPRVGEKHYSLANPEGPMMTSSSKEKEAAWEFIKFITSGEAALLYTRDRNTLPVRRSVAANEGFNENRFLKQAVEWADTWWSPPYHHQHWANFQDRIVPYWQEALGETITPAEFCQQGAKLLRGEA